MNARTLTSKKSIRACCSSLPIVVMAVLPALILAVGLGMGREAATAFEGEEVTVGAGTVSDQVGSDPAAVVEPDPIATALAPDPTSTTPAYPDAPGEAPVSDPAATVEPTSTEPPVVGPATPTEVAPAPVPTAVGIDVAVGPDEAVLAAAESTTIEIGTCLPASGSNSAIDQGGTGVYDCVATITVAQVPEGFAEIVLDWAITTDGPPSWIVELRANGSTGTGEDDGWNPGAAPGLNVIERLGADDDIDGNTADEAFSYAAHFEVRLGAPSCGGPIEPDVVLTPSILPTIDGISGWRRHGELARPVQPVLVVSAPAPLLSRGDTGVLDDAVDRLRFSHADQTVDAGTLDLTVTSGYCGGWNVSISATDFWSEAGDSAFGAGNLALATTGTGSGAPHPAAALTLSNGDQSIVSASLEPLPVGTYTYSFSLTLTIPGGTPPGIYISTVTVTTSAAP